MVSSNHEEYSNYITLENLKCLAQIDWVRTYLFIKSNERT